MSFEGPGGTNRLSIWLSYREIKICLTWKKNLAGPFAENWTVAKIQSETRCPLTLETVNAARRATRSLRKKCVSNLKARWNNWKWNGQLLKSARSFRRCRDDFSNSKETCRWIEDGTKNKEKERETKKRKYVTRGFRVVTFLIHIVRSLRACRAGRLKVDNCPGKRLLVVHYENEAKKKKNGNSHPAFFCLLSIFSKRKGKVNGHKREVNSFRPWWMYILILFLL